MSGTAYELARVKFDNFLQKFNNEINELVKEGVVERKNITWQALFAELVVAKPYWSVLEKHEDAVFKALLEAADLDYVVRLYDSCDEEKRKLLWRYVDFFLKATREVLQ